MADAVFSGAMAFRSQPLQERAPVPPGDAEENSVVTWEAKSRAAVLAALVLEPVVRGPFSLPPRFPASC